MGKGLLCGVAVGALIMMEEKLLCMVVVGVSSVSLLGGGASCVVAMVVSCHVLACSSLWRMMLSCTLMLQRWCKSSSIDLSSCDMCYTGSVTMCIFAEEDVGRRQQKGSSNHFYSSVNAKKEIMGLMREHLGNQNH